MICLNMSIQFCFRMKFQITKIARPLEVLFMDHLDVDFEVMPNGRFVVALIAKMEVFCSGVVGFQVGGHPVGGCMPEVAQVTPVPFDVFMFIENVLSKRIETLK